MPHVVCTPSRDAMSSSPRPSGTTPSPVCLPSLCVRTLLCVPTSCSPISTMQARDSPRKLAISECRGWATCTLASRVIGTLSVFRSYCLVCVRAARGNRELLAFAGARERGASILPLLGPCHTPLGPSASRPPSVAGNLMFSRPACACTHTLSCSYSFALPAHGAWPAGRSLPSVGGRIMESRTS